MKQQNKKTGMTRRRFLASTIGVSTALWAGPVLGQGRPRVVVIGGGAGGATAARYIAKDSKGAIDVTLVEPTRHYYSCFFSNLYLGGFREFASLGHSYGTLAAAYGINVVHDWAVSIDRDRRTVGLAAAAALPSTGSCCRRASTSARARFAAGTCRSRTGCRTPTRRARKRSSSRRR